MNEFDHTRVESHGYTYVAQRHAALPRNPERGVPDGWRDRIDFTLRGEGRTVATVNWPVERVEGYWMYTQAPGGVVAMPLPVGRNSLRRVVHWGHYDRFINDTAEVAANSIFIELRDFSTHDMAGVIPASFTMSGGRVSFESAAFEALCYGETERYAADDDIEVHLDMLVPLFPEEITWFGARPHAAIRDVNKALTRVAYSAAKSARGKWLRARAFCKVPPMGWPGLAQIDRQFARAYAEGGLPVRPHTWRDIPNPAPGIEYLDRIPFRSPGNEGA
jgi:hypothetical protein